jgi:uncharacterized membrane protein SpoIIM required for sporulation
MEIGEAKLQEWRNFATQMEGLRRSGKRGLSKLDDEGLTELLNSYQSLISDLARARSLKAPASTVDYLNRLAVAAHGVLYGYSRNNDPLSLNASYSAFARAVRAAPKAVLLAILCFWVPAVISYFAVQIDPGIAYELVAPEFYNFEPPSAEHMHDIPQLSRPLVASSIISNNIQVTFLAFALGLTAGIGTTYVLVFNGIHIGAVAGWMSYNGQGRALWGWVLPHGSTELMAICLAGAAGYVLAGAIFCPGLQTRARALQKAGRRALEIEIGCMIMLVIAGLIEGLVSPSSIPFWARIVVLLASLGLWGSYFLSAGLEQFSRVLSIYSRPAALCRRRSSLT